MVKSSIQSIKLKIYLDCLAMYQLADCIAPIFKLGNTMVDVILHDPT